MSVYVYVHVCGPNFELDSYQCDCAYVISVLCDICACFFPCMSERGRVVHICTRSKRKENKKRMYESREKYVYVFV